MYHYNEQGENIPHVCAGKHLAFCRNDLFIIGQLLIDLGHQILLWGHTSWNSATIESEWASQVGWHSERLVEESVIVQSSGQDAVLWLAVVTKELRIKLVVILSCEPIKRVVVEIVRLCEGVVGSVDILRYLLWGWHGTWDGVLRTAANHG